MHRHGGPWCPPVLLLLLCQMLLATAGGQGSPECRAQALSAGKTLQLQLEKPPQEWTKVEWRVKLHAGYQQRILTVEKNEDSSPSMSPFSGRVAFQRETLCLQISPVSTADSGVYKAEFEDASGNVTALCFLVSVWEPVHKPQLEARILHRKQGWCNLSLACTVPGAGNVSYSWSCSGDPPGPPEHQPLLQLNVHEDANPTICFCNASNLVSWSDDHIDVTAACHAASSGLFNIVPLWAVAVFLGLALAISVALVVTCHLRRKRGKAPPGGHVEHTLTVYEELGRAQTGQDPNGTREDTVGGNTIYAVICTKTQGPSCPQEPKSCTIYSTVQPRRKDPSLKRKRLDPALVSTAYVEATSGPRPLLPSSSHHHLS